MTKLNVAAAALIAAFAVSAPAFAGSVAGQPTQTVQKSAPKAKAVARPERKAVLDLMSTQSVRKADDKALDAKGTTPVAKTGIAVNPWIVQNIF